MQIWLYYNLQRRYLPLKFYSYKDGPLKIKMRFLYLYNLFIYWLFILWALFCLFITDDIFDLVVEICTL